MIAFMNLNNNNPNETYVSPIQDDQSDWFSDSTSLQSSFSSSTPSTVTYDMEIEQQTQQMTSTLSQDWLPPAVAVPTPLSIIAGTNSSRDLERGIENELFQNIQNLVREFLCRLHRGCPYYRVIRWTIGEESSLEYVLTVIINRPTIILQ